jgi:hypothetical protein
MDSIIRTVLDSDLVTLNAYVEQKVADGIRARIDDKKIDVLASLNKISKEKQVELMCVA